MDAPLTDSQKIEFLERHEPPLKDGDYTLTVTQTVAQAPTAFPPTVQKFSISGERYELNPSDVVGVFPPADSEGDHANVLPHVILGRSTLPWERESQKGQRNWPWMAVLLFDESEAPTTHVVQVKDLPPDARTPETGTHNDDKVTVIDVPKRVLETSLPQTANKQAAHSTGQLLALLAHVRQVESKDGTPFGGERAVVIGHRLGRAGRSSVVHLVSLENRLSGGEFHYGGAKDDADAKDAATVRLVSLKTWNYRCLDETNFMVTAGALATLTARGVPAAVTDALGDALLNTKIVGQETFWSAAQRALQTVAQKASGEKNDTTTLQSPLLKAATYRKLSFKSLLLELDRGPLAVPAPTPATAAAAHLARGYVPLPHHLRNGERTVSWYHGPCISGRNVDAAPELPARTADALLRYNATTGMLDASYAAAWELGRQLSLQSKRFSLALYHWKRSHAHEQKDARSWIDHLPFEPRRGPDLPKTVSDWLWDTALLKGVPFNYLVPDERMLPRESIRFFWVDKVWVESLLDGAFSVGRVLAGDLRHDAMLAAREGGHVQMARHPENAEPVPIESMTGVFLRSDVIAGWPDLQVDGLAVLDCDGAEVGLELDAGTISETLRAALEERRLSLTADDVAVEQLATSSVAPHAGVAWSIHTLDARGRKVPVYEVSLEHGTLQVKLQELRHERLSSNVLLCLFSGEADLVDVHQKPEGLHFGVSDPDDLHPGFYYKDLRDIETGRELGTPDHPVEVKVPLDWEPGDIDPEPYPYSRRIDISQLVEAIQGQMPGTELTSAGFALQMVEGVPRVRFRRAGL